jgi:hypothetical protein
MTKKQKKMLKKAFLAKAKETTILNAINTVAQAVQAAQVTEVLEQKPDALKKPFLIRASEIQIFDEEGRHLKDYKGLVREDKHEKLFSIVSKSYKIAQHEDIVNHVETSLKELELRYESKIIDMDEGARIRMITNFPNIQIKVKEEIFTMRLSWDNSYNLTTGVRLMLGALSPRGYELFVDAKYANFYHRHTKGLDLKHLKNTINKGIEVFKNKVEAEFKQMLETPMTMEKAINFLDNCCEEKVIAETYLSTLKYELKKITPDELDSQFILYNLINKVLGERVASLDTRERHIRAMNAKLKSLK